MIKTNGDVFESLDDENRFTNLSLTETINTIVKKNVYKQSTILLVVCTTRLL